MPNLPTLTAEVAFGTNPTAAPTWDAVTTYTEGFSFRRGRQHEWERVQAGTATLRLDNRDRRYEPAFAGSPYYPNVKRMRRARLQATWDSRTYDLFDGYVDKWPQAYEGHSNAYVDVPLVDGFAVLAIAKLNATYAEQRSSDRVAAVLDAVLWRTGQAWLLGDATYSLLDSTTIVGPTGDRALDSGQTTVQASTLSNTFALQHLLAVDEAENGRLFVGREGALHFHSRHRALTTTSRGTFGDRPDAGELPYAGILLDADTPLYNEVRLQRQGGVEQVASDAASQSAYFVRTYQRTGLLQTSDNEVQDAAHWWLNRHKDEHLRVAALDLDPQGDPDRLWPVVLDAEIGDRWTIRRRPPGGGTAIEQESLLEQIEHRYDVASGRWVVRWHFSPADVTEYWHLEAVGSALGTNTALAY